MTELRIKEILKEKGMTAKSLAERILVTKRDNETKEIKKNADGTPQMGPMETQQLNSIINGGKGASLNTLQKIASALDVPMASLFADYKPEIVDHPIVCPKCGTRLIVKVQQDHDE